MPRARRQIRLDAGGGRIIEDQQPPVVILKPLPYSLGHQALAWLRPSLPASSRMSPWIVALDSARTDSTTS